MGAGKSTLGAHVAKRLGRPFVDIDTEIERRASTSVSAIFATQGEVEFRAIEQRLAGEVLDSDPPVVVSLGGGAPVSPQTTSKLGERALTVLLDVDVDEAWRRARRSDRRPLAQSETIFRELYTQRQPFYERAADRRADDVDGVVLAAAGLCVEDGSFERLAELLPETSEVVADEHVLGLHQLDLDVPIHAVARGEQAKTLETCDRLWRELRLERSGTLVAVGGGSTTDVAGFIASAYLRGIDWAAVPTTLLGQVDAAIGGKTAIDLPGGKNLVGAFHWPQSAIVDPALLATLPDDERLNGLAEVVKTGLLMGEDVWELADVDLVRRCGAFKAAVCLRDPYDRGERRMLNLGHTFAHALEAASDYALPHGRAVALGLTAALELSGLPEQKALVEEVLAPEQAPVDADRAWAALRRDKKATGGQVRLVLLEKPGRPVLDAELPDTDVRRALESLIA